MLTSTPPLLISTCNVRLNTKRMPRVCRIQHSLSVRRVSADPNKEHFIAVVIADPVHFQIFTTSIISLLAS